MAQEKLLLPDPPKAGSGWKEWLKWALLVASLLTAGYAAQKESVSKDEVKEVVKQELAK